MSDFYLDLIEKAKEERERSMKAAADQYKAFVDRYDQAMSIQAELVEALNHLLREPMSERAVDKAKKAIGQAEGRT